MFKSKKDFSFLRLGGLPLLMSILLIMGTSSVQAQSSSIGIDTIGAPAKLIVKLSNKAVMDSVIMPTLSIRVSDTLTTTSDSVAINFAATNKFLFAKSGPYPVVVNGAIVADSARVNSTGTSLFIKISGPVSGTWDTITIAGVYVKGQTTSGIAYGDSTTTDNLTLAIGRTAAPGFTAGSNPATNLVLMPGPIYNATITTQPGGTNTAGSAISANPILSFTDRWGNVPNPVDSVATVTVVPVLSNGTSAGNGTLSNTTTITRTCSQGHPGTLTYTFTNLKYTKAETIRLLFTPPSGTTVTSQASGIVVSPGLAKNISASLLGTATEAITVDGSIPYVLNVTDQYFNPINGETIVPTEATAHGGTFSTVYVTSGSGQDTITFYPGKFFIGADTVVFTDGTAKNSRPITISAGAVGGIIVDYASTASGSATTENIAAGTTVYARGFFRDIYGNPINATSASAFTFSISGKNGTNTLLGASALTSSVTESQYPNTNKSAIGVAIPYTVSSNLRTTADSVLVAQGTYSATVTIQNRSNVPSVVKLVQSVAGDSSLVASVYSSSTTFSDTLWDVYGNLVTAPSSSYKVAPVRSAFAMYMSTMGKAAFVRTADTTTVDTLYASSGIINRTVFSSKTAGLDTLKVWSAAKASVAAAAPFWVTPATFAKVAIAPHADTTAIAGRVDAFTVEKQDTYGNHIDWGLAGANARGNTGATLKPTAAQILSDSTALVADTVSTGSNRGGTAKKSTAVGTAGVASVGGSLDLSVKFTPYTVTADTQKFYVSLGGFKDTVLVRSISTGALASFTVTIAAADSTHNAGDSVKVVVTALDANGNQIYSYKDGGQSFKVNNTSAVPYTAKDSTIYFSYMNNRSTPIYVKSTGVSIADTVFNLGTATLYLHKFVAENSVNTVTVTAGTITATSAKGSKFVPLTSVNQTTWLVTATANDTVFVNKAFNLTITPRDQYYNVNSTATNFASVSSNQGANFSTGTNPVIFAGVATVTATQSVATNNLVIYVSNGSSIINGQTIPIIVVPVAVNATVSGTVAYANTAATPIGNVTVTLTPTTGAALTATSNATTGAYSITAPAGTYTLTAAKTGNWGGANATDALLVAKHSAGITLLTGLPLAAGDVNNSASVNNTDALLIVRRSVGLDASFVGGDWVFTPAQTVTVGSAAVTANISGLAVGDVNASYTPATGTAFAKAPASISLKSGTDNFAIAGSSASYGAVSMKINVNSAKIASISSKLPGFVSRVDNGAVSFGWFAQDGQAVQFKDNEAIVTVTLADKVGDNSNITIQSELADIAGAAVESNLALAKVIPTAFALSQNYPNPFNPSTQINYDLPKAGMVTLSVYNMLGQEVSRIVNNEQKEAGSYTVQWAPRNLASGVYIYRIHVQTDKDSFTSVKRLTLLK